MEYCGFSKFAAAAPPLVMQITHSKLGDVSLRYKHSNHKSSFIKIAKHKSRM